jgi:hypothetical protein
MNNPLIRVVDCKRVQSKHARQQGLFGLMFFQKETIIEPVNKELGSHCLMSDGNDKILHIGGFSHVFPDLI